MCQELYINYVSRIMSDSTIENTEPLPIKKLPEEKEIIIEILKTSDNKIKRKTWKKSKPKFKCHLCNDMYSFRGSLQRHLKKVHGQYPERRRPFVCPVPYCSGNFKSSTETTNHLKVRHGEALDTNWVEMIILFRNMEDFFKWKKEEEERTNFRYKKDRGDQKLANGVVKASYSCHRSGHFKSFGKGIRRMKEQGTCKIGSFCPASINLKRSPEGDVIATYIGTHIGHEADVKHNSLTREEREFIATQLAMNIPFKDVLDNIRDQIGNDNLTRLHLITRKDLENVVRDFKLPRGHIVHRKDSEIVISWVEKVQSESSQLVRLVKIQGEESLYPDLDKEDFLLVIMSDMQLNVMSSYSHNEIVVESVRGYSPFHLTTVIAIDEDGEGFPIAFAYSDHVSENILRMYFTVVKEVIGTPITNCTFISDDNRCYVNAWTAVMGVPDKKVISSWHADRSWRKHLLKVKGESEIKVIYKTLRLLLETQDTLEFSSQMSEFLGQLSNDDNMVSFYEYFYDKYASCPKEWAYCYKVTSKVTNSKTIESLNRELKQVLMNGRRAHRMDTSIPVLLELLRTKSIHLLQHMPQLNAISYINRISEQHAASEVPSVSVVMKQDESWIVKCNNDVYEVTQLELVPSALHCALCCVDCDICIHSYKCTCVSNMSGDTLCTHIHLVVRHLQDNRTTPNFEYMAIVDGDNEEVVIECIVDNVTENVIDEGNVLTVYTVEGDETMETTEVTSLVETENSEIIEFTESDVKSENNEVVIETEKNNSVILMKSKIQSLLNNIRDRVVDMDDAQVLNTVFAEMRGLDAFLEEAGTSNIL